MLVLASVPPINLLVEERQETFQFRKELTCTDLQEIARAKETIHKDGRHRLVEKWQARWHGDQSGRWTHRLIPELTTWMDSRVATARSLVDNAEHTLFFCARWGAEREALSQAVGAELTPDMMVSLMLQSERFWSSSSHSSHL